jgi:hypothetical protein
MAIRVTVTSSPEKELSPGRHIGVLDDYLSASTLSNVKCPSAGHNNFLPG